MDKIALFEVFINEYDNWFDEHNLLYLSELDAVNHFIPKGKRGLEIGVGTARFAALLGIEYGIEPSEKMAGVASSRGIKVIRGVAENLPLKADSFDFVLFVTTLCFVRNVSESINEAKRVLKKNGLLIIGLLDKDSVLGRNYLIKRKGNKMYQHAVFYSAVEILALLKAMDFLNFSVIQTIFSEQNERQKYIKGYGKGLFVVIKAVKRKGDRCSQVHT
ncbi:MAG: hypothetical protein A2Y62_00510 [Candidatus Fischerbacteria bacterium RBG_13_37_8]|uniref:Methyltransferase type 11 domain-containing protein n=1 Tax=Candidatus Fischerbacteria bacterium RBG_13_37_8 TaxID=1817863 RepID=A0A1F5VIL5_9BACT|nr:MAG: hypothetical protein A2Y62_00510 [Candidatus Fischerbacteria bacterium RBG_13_37_8]